jgi:hypothetical protein
MEGKAMDAKHRNNVNKVIDKLETLDNFFEFYGYAREKTGFNEDSINGLSLILRDCIVELRETVK